MVFFLVIMTGKHQLPHLNPICRECAPKQQQIALLPWTHENTHTRQTAPAGCYRARIPVVLFPSMDLVRIEFSGKQFESSDRERIVPCECRRALECQETTPGGRAMLGGIELPVLFAVFFVFKFLFFYSASLCKTGVGSSSPLPECFQKIEKNFLRFDHRLFFPFHLSNSQPQPASLSRICIVHLVQESNWVAFQIFSLRI